MRKRNFISTVLILVVLISCKIDGGQKAKAEIQKTKDLKTIKLDTLDGDNFDLIFFHPNEKEFEILLNENESEGLYEVDSDFGYYVNKAIDSLNKDWKIKMMDERIIKFKTKNGFEFFDRLENDNSPYGIIFNKIDCNPRIEYGVMVEIGIIQTLLEYNKNCK